MNCFIGVRQQFGKNIYAKCMQKYNILRDDFPCVLLQRVFFVAYFLRTFCVLSAYFSRTFFVLLVWPGVAGRSRRSAAAAPGWQPLAVAGCGRLSGDLGPIWNRMESIANQYGTV